MGCGGSTAAAPSEEKYVESSPKATAKPSSPQHASKKQSRAEVSASKIDLFSCDIKEIKKKKRPVKRLKEHEGSPFVVSKRVGDTSNPVTVSIALNQHTLRLKVTLDDPDDVKILRDILSGRRGIFRPAPSPDGSPAVLVTVDTELIPQFGIALTKDEVDALIQPSSEQGTVNLQLSGCTLPKLLLPRLHKPRFRGGCLRFLRGFGRPFSSVVLSPDEKALVGLQRGKPLPSAMGLAGGPSLAQVPSCIAFDSSKRSSHSSVRSVLAKHKVDTWEKSIRHVDLFTGTVVGVFKSKDPSSFKDLAYVWSDSDPLVYGATVEGPICIFNASRQRYSKCIEVNPDQEEMVQLAYLKVSPDLKYIVTGGSCDASEVVGGGGLVSVYEVGDRGATAVHVRSFVGHKRATVCLDFHPSNSDIAASGDLKGEVLVWRLTDLAVLQKVLAHNSPLRSLVYTPTGLLMTCDDRFLRCWINDELVMKCHDQKDNRDLTDAVDDASAEDWEPSYEPYWTKHNDSAAVRHDGDFEEGSLRKTSQSSKTPSEDGDMRSESEQSESGSIEKRNTLPSVAPMNQSKRRLRSLHMVPGGAVLVLSTAPLVEILDVITGEIVDSISTRCPVMSASVGRTMAVLSDSWGNVFAYDMEAPNQLPTHY